MSKLNAIKQMLSKIIHNFSEVTDSDGVVILWTGDEPAAVGTNLSTYDEEMNPIPLPAGTYKVEGAEWTVGDGGVLSEIKPAEPKEDPKEPEVEMNAKTADVIMSAITMFEQSLKEQSEKLKTLIDTMEVRLSELEKKPVEKPIDQKPLFSNEKDSNPFSKLFKKD